MRADAAARTTGRGPSGKIAAQRTQARISASSVASGSGRAPSARGLLRIEPAGLIMEDQFSG
jgi:hypothetical protein